MGIVLTHSAKYKPMSFEDMIKPYVMATEEYRTLEKGIADLDAEAESLRSLAEKDIVRKEDGSVDKEKSKSYAIKYMDYADSLDKQAEQLASRGLKGVNRKSLYDLQAQYKTNVKPIEEADKYIKEIAKEQRLANKEGNLVFDRDFSNGVSIQDVIDNPSLGYTPYNLNNYRTLGIQAAAAASARREQILKDPILGNQYYKILTGYGKEEAEKFIEDHSTIPILNQTLIGLTTNIPEHLKGVIENAVLEGMKTGLTQKTSYQANRNYRSDADRYRDTTARIKAEADRLKAQNDLMGDLQGTPSLPSRSIVFDKDFTDVGTLLDPETGNIKYMTEITDPNGKIYRPEVQWEPVKRSPGNSASISFDVTKDYRTQYDNIKKVLLARGITEEKFNSMSTKDVNDIIKNIDAGKTDARLKTMITMPTFSSSATDHFISQLQTLGIVPKEIIGYDKDTKSNISGRGTYKVKELETLEDLPYNKNNSTMILGYDAANGVPIMMLNGTYYELPTTVFDDRDRDNIETYASEQGQRALQEQIEFINEFAPYSNLTEADLNRLKCTEEEKAEYIKNQMQYKQFLSNVQKYNTWIKEFMQNSLRTSGIVNVTTKPS
jgi:hypothetical protein